MLAAHSYRRVPLVKRVEYLVDFLEVVKSGYSKDVAEAKLVERKKSFEIEKARAVGRGRPFTQGLKKAPRLVKYCVNLSRHTGLIAARGGAYRLTDRGSRLLQMISERQEHDAFLFNVLLRTYLSFQQIILAIDSTEGHEVLLPSEAKKNVFLEYAMRYDIPVDLWTFDIVRDLCSQLGILNWHPVFENKEKMQRVFMTCTILNFTSGHDEDQNSCFPLNVTFLGRKVTIERNSTELDNFKDILWKEYLKMTNYVPRRPVFYSALRARVCYALRISDKTFDQFAARLMEKDNKYLLLAAGGSLPFSHDSAGMLKSLPPQTSRGEYMVYLKMDEKRQ